MIDPTIVITAAPGSLRKRVVAFVVPLASAALALGLVGVVIAGTPASAEPHVDITTVQLPTLARHESPLVRYEARVKHPVKTVAAPVAAAAPAPAAPAPTVAAPEPVAAAGPTWSIGITAVGLQAEVDACQWVLMDFSSSVPKPVVAAHNFCGGGIVLQMQVGETVSLSGAGLDGSYVVIASKDAWADQDAADAISGLAGDVILQTCYWEDDGHLMLVGLQRVG